MKMSDRKILELSLSTGNRAKIAREMGITEAEVRRVLASQEVQEELEEISAEQTLRLRGLYEKAVNAISGALDSNSDTVRLMAAKEWFKITGRYGVQQTHAMSAEDLARSLMNEWRNQQYKADVEYKADVVVPMRKPVLIEHTSNEAEDKK